MKLPYNMRPSTLKERKHFYSNFNIDKTKRWVERKLVYAVIIGSHSDIYKKKYSDDKSIPLIIDKYDSLEKVKSLIIKFLPEGFYYDRNYYKDISLCHDYNLRNAWDWDNFEGQELAFDIDPENVNCPIHGTLKERMNKGEGLSFCEKAFGISKENTLKLYEKLEETYEDIRAVFSGRGFHIHVFDKEVVKLSQKQRKKIAEKYNEYGIDKWVTSGEMRLIRMPYTLNGISSRIVKPLTKNEIQFFDPEKDALPTFIE